MTLAAVHSRQRCKARSAEADAGRAGPRSPLPLPRTPRTPQVDSDFGDVNRELRKVITKDSNVACVAEAIACTGALAKGLRKAYRGTAATLCPGARR